MSATTSRVMSATESLDVVMHTYGISEFSDITLVAERNTSTHHYRTHKVILATHSNWFKAIFVGDPSATVITLPATVCQQLQAWEWMLEQWYASITEHTATFREQHQVEVGDTVVYDAAPHQVLSVDQPYVTLRRKQSRTRWLADPRVRRSK